MIDENVLVVKLVTSFWADNRGLHKKQSLLYQKRKSKGINLLDEDSHLIGADEAARNFVNLSESKDGLYKVEVCNESRDYETGMIDSYDYKLVPFDI